jgi:hypothetical protein
MSTKFAAKPPTVENRSVWSDEHARIALGSPLLANLKVLHGMGRGINLMLVSDGGGDWTGNIQDDFDYGEWGVAKIWATLILLPNQPEVWPWTEEMTKRTMDAMENEGLDGNGGPDGGADGGADGSRGVDGSIGGSIGGIPRSPEWDMERAKGFVMDVHDLFKADDRVVLREKMAVAPFSFWRANAADINNKDDNVCLFELLCEMLTFSMKHEFLFLISSLHDTRFNKDIHDTVRRYF